MKVWVAVVSHKYGNNIYASKTHAGAMKQVYEYVEEWWTDIFGSESPIPKDSEEAVYAYFEHFEDMSESYEVDEIEVAG